MPAADVDDPTPPLVISWLNSLCVEEAHEMHFALSEETGTRLQTFLPAALERRLSRCSSVAAPSRDGLFWIDWLCCRISNLTPNTAGGREPKTGHPRYKIVVPRDMSRAGDQLKLVRDSVSPAHFDEFCALPPPPKTTKECAQVRMHAHHVAYTALRARDKTLPLLETVGGRKNQKQDQHSVSHKCDRVGCLRLVHLEYVKTTKENSMRQRCVGMILVVMGDVIIAESPCAHAIVPNAGSPVDASSLDSCCRRLKIVCVGEQWPELAETWPRVGKPGPGGPEAGEVEDAEVEEAGDML